MCCSSPSPPPPPDYAGAAAAQGAANVETARTQGRMNNPNVFTPYGSQVITWGQPSSGGTTSAGGGGGTTQPATTQPTLDQNAYNTALSQWQAQYGNANPEGNAVPPQPDPSQFMTGGGTTMPGATVGGTTSGAQNYIGDQPTITQTLNPQSQAIFDAQQAARLGLAGVAQQGIGNVQNVLGQPFQFQGPSLQTSIANPSVSGAPDLSSYGQAGSNVAAGQGIAQTPNLAGFGQAGTTQGAGQGIQGGPQLQGQIGPAGGIQAGPQAGQYGMAGGIYDNTRIQTGLPNVGDPRRAFDTSQIARMPINAGTTAQQAIMSRLQPQLERGRSQLETQLRNQGLVAGGEAYNESMELQNQRENDLLTQAALQGINLDLLANQQGFGQAQAQGQFGNQAQQQAYQQALASGQFGNLAAGQQFGQGLAAQQLGNQAVAQNFGQGLSAAQLQNMQQQQQFGQNLAGGQFANQAALAQQQAQNQAQQQAFAQQAAQQQMGNQAISQNQQAALAQQLAQNQAQQQQFGQQMGVQGLQNQALAQNQQAALQQQQAANQAAAQQFNQNLQSGQFGNTAQQQMLQQQLYQRNLPLNEIAALMSGSQIQNPQFQPYQGSSIAPPPIFNAAQQQAQYNQGLYNAQMGAQNSFMGGLFQLGAAGIGAYPWGAIP